MSYPFEIDAGQIIWKLILPLLEHQSVEVTEQGLFLTDLYTYEIA